MSLIMSFSYLGSLLQWLVNGSMVTFYSAGGVRAKQRNVEITQKGDDLLCTKPSPFFNFSNFFVTLNLFVTHPVRACRQNFEPALKRFGDDPQFKYLEMIWSGFECRLLGQFRPLKKTRSLM